MRVSCRSLFRERIFFGESSSPMLLVDTPFSGEVELTLPESFESVTLLERSIFK